MSPIQFGHPVVTCMYYFGTKIHLQYRADNKYVDRYVFVCIFDFSLSLSDSCLRNSANMYLMMCDMQETEMYFFFTYYRWLDNHLIFILFYIISNSLKGHSMAPLALSGFLKIEGGEIGPNLALGYFDKINVHRNFYWVLTK